MTADGPLPLKRYAGGGIANSPQLAMFGEGSGPEAYVPLPDGRSIPVSMKGGSGAVSSTVNVHIHGSDADNDSQQSTGERGRQLGDTIKSVVIQTILNEKRPGGTLA